MTRNDRTRVFDAIGAIIKGSDEERASASELLAGNVHEAAVALFLSRFAAAVNALSVFAGGAFGLFLIVAALNGKVDCSGISIDVPAALAIGVCLAVVLSAVYLMNMKLFAYRVTARAMRVFVIVNLLFSIMLAVSVAVTLFGGETIKIAIAFMIAPVIGVCYNFMALIHWSAYNGWFDSMAKKVLKKQ